jgi:hypothetical protein
VLDARYEVDLRGAVVVEMLRAGLDDGRACRETGEAEGDGEELH